jgi:hypothetical protein
MLAMCDILVPSQMTAFTWIPAGSSWRLLTDRAIRPPFVCSRKRFLFLVIFVVATDEASMSGRRPCAGSVLTHHHRIGHLPAETARWSTITQIYEGTNQIQRMVMARHILGGTADAL